MRKLQKIAVVAALLGSVGFAGAGTAFAHGDGGFGGDQFQVQQSTSCKSHDLNLDVLGEVGVLNGVAGNLLGGEGNPGAQASKLGSSLGCNNSAFGG
ncbi:hypothetical protein [Streptacidiphilus sp. P02-A3a]|uniref:hypothetical protein n=1 Tax=Streptacidiphilus sp. P02-A3a TaxID=2704468 RepID=UPI0015F8923E|nr:hypothetical protein [Streptacidiphilus sp. P02-A3a]QMU70199.1 hypothetical protein GXP74_20205 [Streptacidiphilus sp. P02-A3a]QMU70349.1 hypothetical protein GXP74_21190 [Streptacidiphilus sp. P02-A3a]